jgi:hypothetical protein
MKRKVPVACFFAILALTGCSSDEGKFFDLCEKAIKESLRSPSGYKRISKEVEAKALSVDEFLKKNYTDQGKDIAKEQTESQRRLFESGAVKPAEFTALVEYDAPNAYGTLVRERVYCTHLSSNGKVEYVTSGSIKVNGKSANDRLSDFVNSLPVRH